MVSALTELVRLKSPPRTSVAIDAALAMGLTIAPFAAVGRVGDGLVASMGAFSVLYFVDAARPSRLRRTACVALGLTVVGVLGAECGPHALLGIAFLALVAGGVSVVMQAVNAGPPGGLMFVLTAGASAHLALSSFPAFKVGYLIAWGGSVGCLIVAASGFWRTSVARALPASSWNWGEVIIDHVVRVFVAAAASGLAAATVHTDRPYWAMAAATAVLRPGERERTMSRAVHRFVGACAGVLVFMVIEWHRPGGLWLAASVAILQGLGEAFVVANYAIGMVFITPVALLIASSGNAPDAIQVRLVDTVIGAATALLVGWGGRGLMDRLRASR